MCVMKNRKKAILIALAIGDGHINRRRSGNKYHSSLRIQHSIKQKELITYKRDLLHSIIGGKLPKLIEFNNSGYPGIKFSKGHKYFRILRKWLYPNGKKKISRFLLNKLTAEAIAIWYMDDGGLSAKKHKGKIHSYELFLNTHESIEDNQIIIDYFKEEWNIQFHQVKNKGSYRLRMGTKEARCFIPIIEKYILPSMKYKITMVEPSIRGRNK